MPVGTPEVLDEWVPAFMEGPVSILLATVDGLRTPDAVRSGGAAVVGPDRIRILANGTATTVANAREGARASLLVTEVTTYRSLQWKGTVVAAERPITPGDRALHHRHLEAFRAGLVSVDTDPVIVEGVFADFVPYAIELLVDAAFDQTPGAGAGEPL